MSEGQQTVACQICGQEQPRAAMVPGAMVRDSIAAAMRADHPDWSPDGYVCRADLNRYRTAYFRDLVEADKGELTSLDQEVLESLAERELLAKNVNEEFDIALTVGQRVADKVADFGGSWTFILMFMGLLLLWIVLNSLALLRKPFDPYPFILLNLVLSCVAAMQAPVIMMSQNRQEAKDRLRAEHDYQINLRAELEIRNLNEKIDHLIHHQWQRLLELQQIQSDMMEDLSPKAP
jgi:uncharacterized membrane protein